MIPRVGKLGGDTMFYFLYFSISWILCQLVIYCDCNNVSLIMTASVTLISSIPQDLIFPTIGIDLAKHYTFPVTNTRQINTGPGPHANLFSEPWVVFTPHRTRLSSCWAGQTGRSQSWGWGDESWASPVTNTLTPSEAHPSHRRRTLK